MYDKRLQPEADRIIIARLHGSASHHARWREPSGAETAAAVAELRAITTDPALLGQVAGVLYGFSRGGLYQDRDFCAAGYLIAAGADQDWVWYWAVIGHERAERVRTHAPWQDWEPGGDGRVGDRLRAAARRGGHAPLWRQPSAGTVAAMSLATGKSNLLCSQITAAR